MGSGLILDKTVSVDGVRADIGQNGQIGSELEFSKEGLNWKGSSRVGGGQA